MAAVVRRCAATRPAIDPQRAADLPGPGARRGQGLWQQPEAFDARSELLLTRFGEQAAILLSNVATLDQAEQLSERLREALRVRNVIALANGILMERHRLSEEQAFLRLVDQARVGQRELADEAATVIGSTPPQAE